MSIGSPSWWSVVVAAATDVAVPDDPGLEIVADERLRHPAQEGERIDMGTDPIGQRLAEAGLGEGIVRCPQDRDEDLGNTHFPGEPVEHRHGIASEVHKTLT